MTTLKLFYSGKEKHICRENSFVLLQQNWKERSTTKIKPYVEVTRSLTSHIYSRCRFSTFNKNIFSETWTFQRSSVVFLQHWVLCGEEKWGDGKVFTHPCAPAENRKGRDSNHSNFDSYWFFKRKGMYGGCRSWQRLYASCSTLNLTSWRVFPHTQLPSWLYWEETDRWASFLVVEDLALLWNTVNWPDLSLAFCS